MNAKTIADEICKGYRIDLFKKDRQSVKEIIQKMKNGLDKIQEENRREILKEAITILEYHIEAAEDHDYYMEHCPEGLQ